MEITKIVKNFNEITREIKVYTKKKITWGISQIYRNIEFFSPITYLLPEVNLSIFLQKINFVNDLPIQIFIHRVVYTFFIFLNLCIFASLFRSFFENCFVILVYVSDINNVIENEKMNESVTTLVNEEKIELSSQGSWSSLGSLE